MAKRKRLSPAAMHGSGSPAPETKPAFSGPPPIASVAGEAAQTAALETLVEEMRQARESGRLIQGLALDAIDEAYLMRDRVAFSEPEFGALVESIRTRGQQTPIEVMALDVGRFGLISGWRRLSALKQLAAQDPDRFGTVQAILRRPDSAADAYQAMVEENEIRVGLSYYERARIAARAAEGGIYSDKNTALTGLFGSASRARRSKIGSFIRIYEQLDPYLSYPAAIPERLGLALSKALAEDAALSGRLAKQFAKAPAGSAGEELAALEKAIRGGAKASKTPKAPAGTEVAPGVFLRARGKDVVLSGLGVDDRLREDLKAWLSRRNEKGA